MPLKQIKIAVAAAWMLAILIVGLVLQRSSGEALALLAAFGVLPPIAMWRLWTEPVQTLSESIQAGRR